MLSKTLSMFIVWNIQESSVQIETGPAATVCTRGALPMWDFSPFGSIRGGDAASRLHKNELNPRIVL